MGGLTATFDRTFGTNVSGDNPHGYTAGTTAKKVGRNTLKAVDDILDVPLNMIGMDSNLSGWSKAELDQLKEIDPARYEAVTAAKDAQDARADFREYQDEMGELFGWKRGEGFTKPTEMTASGAAMQEGARDQRARDLSSVKGRQAGRYGALSDRLMMSGADQGALERASLANERTSGMEEQQTMGQYSNLLNKIQSENILQQEQAQRQFAQGAGLQAPQYQATMAEGGRQFDAGMKAKYDIANMQAQLGQQAGKSAAFGNLGNLLGMGATYLAGGGPMAMMLGGMGGSTLLGGGSTLTSGSVSRPTYDMNY